MLFQDQLRLCETHPDHADAIVAKTNETKGQWENLKRKAAERKAGLDRSYQVHRFLADYRFVVFSLFLTFCCCQCSNLIDN